MAPRRFPETPILSSFAHNSSLFMQSYALRKSGRQLSFLSCQGRYMVDGAFVLTEATLLINELITFLKLVLQFKM